MRLCLAKIKLLYRVLIHQYLLFIEKQHSCNALTGSLKIKIRIHVQRYAKFLKYHLHKRDISSGVSS